MTNNDIIKAAIIQARERIVGGLNISRSMASVGFFPNMVVKMIQVGEESGSLSTVLERTSIHYERKVDTTITMMTSLLEPIMIVSVGAIVLVVVCAVSADFLDVRRKRVARLRSRSGHRRRLRKGSK